MTVIYLDTLFLLNGIIDYLLLLAAARLSGEPLNRRRYLLGGVLGGLYAAVMPIPAMEFLLDPLCRAAAGILMAVAAYGGSRRLLRQTVIFVLLTLAFGGGVAAVSLMGGEGLFLGHGIYYSQMDFKIVLLSGGLCYAVITAVMGKAGVHTSGRGELVPVQLAMGENTCTLNALLDTGNTLTDPVTGRPVMVADGVYLISSLGLPLSERQIRDPVLGAEELQEQALRGRIRLIPYRAVGVDRAMLLALRMDEVAVNRNRAEGVLVALSPTPVSDGGTYQALLSPAAIR